MDYAEAMQFCEMNDGAVNRQLYEVSGVRCSRAGEDFSGAASYGAEDSIIVGIVNDRKMKSNYRKLWQKIILT